MALVWQYGEKSGFESWKGLSWGMVSNASFSLKIFQGRQVTVVLNVLCACKHKTENCSS